MVKRISSPTTSSEEMASLDTNSQEWKQAAEPANPLEKALVAAASDPAARFQFYETLEKSDIFIPQADRFPHASKLSGHEDGKSITTEPVDVVIQTVVREGSVYVPFFSSLLQLQLSVLGHHPRYLCLNAIDFMKMHAEAASDATLVLNPGLPHGKDFTPQEVAAIVDGSIFASNSSPVTRHGSVALSQHSEGEYPRELVDALCRCMAGLPQIHAAHIALIGDDTDQPPSTLIALVVDDDSEIGNLVSGPLGMTTQNDAGCGPVDFAPASYFGDYFDNQEPFYARGN